MDFATKEGTPPLLSLRHCGNGFEEIAGCAWLMLKYAEARQLVFKTAGRFISKEEFLAAPQYSIAVTPLTLVFLMQRRMLFAHLILGEPPAQNGALPVQPNTKKQVRELRIASKG
jgi:hypothetical protein